MAITVNVNNLPQNGRPGVLPSQVNPTSLRYVAIVDTTPIDFVFPQGAGTNFIFGIPRSVFIDNSFNTFEMLVSVQGTAYSFPVPALSSGYYYIDAIDGDTIVMTSQGVSDNIVEVVFYNYDKNPVVWYKFQATTTAITIANGADIAEGNTSDPAVTNPASNATVISVLKGILSLLGSGIVIATSKVQGLVANGSTVATAGNPLVVAGQDGANSRSLLTDNAGRLTIIGNGTFATQSAVTVANGADVTQGAVADAAVTNPASSGSVIAFLKGILTQLQAAIPAGTNTIGNVGIVDAGVSVIGDSGNVANAVAVATLAGTASKTTYITGFTVSGSGSTLGLPVTVTITGLLGGTKSYTYGFLAGALLENTPINVQFSRPIPASAQNTAIVVTCPAGGAGNTNNTTTAEGFQL